MLLETLSTPFTKALRNGNSTAAAFSSIIPRTTAPVPVSSGPNAAGGTDGVYDFSDHHYFTVNRLQLMPYADGNTGSQFSMRVFGWDVIEPPDANPNLIVWIPFLICELAVTTGALVGFAGRYLSATEHLATTITLTQGLVGGTDGITGGRIYSYTDTSLAGWVLLTISGCRYIQFDFQKTSANIGMNCLWGKS
jgi:hypothetical protein